ncbi:hypothetical protein LP419_16840 [Massilia sp. H-1]|nr:hypothetical protein LP419_16840 [Massilia sp. H-1]
MYANDDWPLWQKAERRAATLRYAARTPDTPGKTTVPLLRPGRSHWCSRRPCCCCGGASGASRTRTSGPASRL